MERPIWASVVLSGALPRELSDIIAILILETLAIQLALLAPRPFLGLSVSWILVVMVPLVCLLAAMSNSPNREREELALVAYGGSAKQIELRYVLRGAIVTTIGLTPVLLKLVSFGLSISTGLIILILLVLIGGWTYSLPALRRTRSTNFVEHYKG